ncbi:lasso peptide biosynthesis B2 protein [Cellulosimicrobium sp. PMB13]|uniref:lasso peptide biosynthesis B2 protein n=1 Tax=Cellulosimicrobium sp. PMB13 TaxID=3120158 RepID=UPI003F4C96EB
MSVPVAPERRVATRGLRRARVRGAVAVARVAALLPPLVLVRVLRLASRGARESGVDEAQVARDEVCGASVRCAGLGCLQRSVAVVLLCRTEGHVPGWRTGFRPEPFTAHAWVTSGGRPVGEPPDVGGYRVVLAVDPRTTGAPRTAADEHPGGIL